MTEQLLTFPELAAEVMQWAEANFNGKYNSYLGMTEELGELARCCLKRHQGIRGYDDDAFYLERYMDAVGDIGVYAGNFAVMEGLTTDWPTSTVKPIREKRNHYFGLCSLYLSRLVVSTYYEDRGHSFAMLFLSVDLLAQLEGFTLAEATNQVWQKVKQRNWVKNKENGLA
jgi:hypothetical protein